MPLDITTKQKKEIKLAKVLNNSRPNKIYLVQKGENYIIHILMITRKLPFPIYFILFFCYINFIHSIAFLFIMLISKTLPIWHSVSWKKLFNDSYNKNPAFCALSKNRKKNYVDDEIVTTETTMSRV